LDPLLSQKKKEGEKGKEKKRRKTNKAEAKKTPNRERASTGAKQDVLPFYYAQKHGGAYAATGGEGEYLSYEWEVKSRLEGTQSLNWAKLKR